MRFHEVDEIRDRRLGHITGRDRGVNHTSTSLLTYAMSVRRPATGKASSPVFCGTCERNVAVVVSSAQRTRIVRRIWLAAGLLCVATIVATIMALNGNAEDPLIGALVLESGIALCCFSAWWLYLGISVQRGQGPGVRRLHHVVGPKR